MFKKPIDKPILFVKPFPKPFPIPKRPFFPPDMPVVEPGSFLKSKPFFKKPTPKLPLHLEYKKPFLLPLPIHKPIPSPLDDKTLPPHKSPIKFMMLVSQD